jgi:hypothetical protein
MNSLDRQLGRLFKAAASADPNLSAGVSPRWAERALGHLRTAHAEDRDAPSVRVVLRGGLLCACLVALAAVVFGFLDTDPLSTDQSTLLNTPVTWNNLP